MKTKWAYTAKEPNGLVETMKTMNGSLVPKCNNSSVSVSTATPERSCSTRNLHALNSENLGAALCSGTYACLTETPIDTDIVIKEAVVIIVT